MSDEQPAGPDLSQGIRTSELADGAMIAGRVGEEEVVLARRGDEYFAFSAHCTHYHGPLVEGRFSGETIHCPWHHACFNVRTGSPDCAPAYRPLKVFTTSRNGDLVRVGNELTPAKPTSQPDPQHIVIIGGGAAGAFAANELRRLGFAGRVTLLSRDDRPPFDKPNLSKDYLAGRAPVEWIPLRDESEYAADNIDLRLGATVERIDSNAVHLANGEAVKFDRLILATGASPRKLDIPSAQPIHYLRTWSDADALIALVQNARKTVVIGASFIGLETAASLRERGLDVTVIGAEERPLERVLGRELGDFIRRTHEEHGVRFRLGRKPVEVRNDAVVLDDGSTEPCDFVVAGVGVIPETGLAERAGLKIDRGIAVDEFMQTSAPNIFAAGDVARIGSMRVEHWVAAGKQGQLAARNAMGRRERYDGVPFFWSQHYDLVFAYVGHAERADDVTLFGSLADHNVAAVYRENGRITAVVTLFRDDVSLAVEAAMQRKESSEAIETIVRAAFP